MKQSSSDCPAVQPAWSFNLLATVVGRLGRRNRIGTLVVTLPDGRRFEFAGQEEPDQIWDLEILHPRALWRLVTRGNIGLAEGYIRGEWRSNDLSRFLELGLRNEAAMRRTQTGIGLARMGDQVRHWWRANTHRQSRRNITYHYDLGNAFYRLWLDPSMTYSSALFNGSDESLEQGQRNKYAAIAAMAGVLPGDSVLEIGCGWGGFAEYAADEIDCDVTGISISSEQVAYARERLGDKARLEFQDYRELRGDYDRIVSIEMFEAVGEKYWPVYARTLKRLLKPGGSAALQVITIEAHRLDEYRRKPDFIQRYIFPGGMLPSEPALTAAMEDAGLRVTETKRFGLDYARTLVEWRERFEAARGEITALGFDDRFRRLWRFYLCYCEAGFRAGAIDVVQVKIEHADQSESAAAS